MSRLDNVYNRLWWAGRQVPTRSLHRWKMLGLKITIVEQADLHLVWSVESLFVKPLPTYLLDYSIWLDYICRDDRFSRTYEDARGFLLSYTWLIRYKSDFEIAKEAHLLPDHLTWSAWRDLVDSLWDHFHNLSNQQAISKRYRYGSLRLSRLDQIYRFSCGELLDGYLQSYSSYGGFFRREFAWLIVAFAYASIILAAMQLGLTIQQLQENGTFNNVSYGVTVAAIMLPASILAFALVLGAALWTYNYFLIMRAWLNSKKVEKH